MIYVRVSTDEQVSSGAGLEAQEAECRRYAEEQGWQVVEVITEEATSGKLSPFKRPGFQRALSILDGCDAGTLLVRRDDRISRHLRFTLDVVYYADLAGWSVATTDGKWDTSTASGRLQINVKGSVAQYEVDVIGERTTEALAARKEAGVRLGRPVSTPPDLIALVVSLRDDVGLTWQAIADHLAEAGHPTSRGGAWRVSTVQGIYRSAQLDQYAAERKAQR